MICTLPTPVPANYDYTGLRIENIQYDGSQYTADVYGMVDGQAVPFIYKSASGALHRVSQYSITDAEINDMLAIHPEMSPTDRVVQS